MAARQAWAAANRPDDPAAAEVEAEAGATAAAAGSQNRHIFDTGADGLWMTQIGRNLTDDVDGLFKGKRYLIHDRDPFYTKEFLSMLAERDIESVKLPPRSPNLNA
jgi:hypothetical protein